MLIKDTESFEIYLPNYKKTCYDAYNEIGRRLILFSASSFEEKKKVQEKLVNSDYKEEEKYRNCEKMLEK